MANELTIYECKAIQERIEAQIEANDGEITDEQLEALVKAQTTSIEKVGNLCGYMKFLEHGIDSCKKEEARIAQMRRVGSNRLEGIKKFLTPFVQDKGKLTVGTFRLSTRKSQSVIIDNGLYLAEEYWRTIPEEKLPDKIKIKETLNAGFPVDGAHLETSTHLQLR